MSNIIDTPPRSGQRAGRDRVSLLEIVGAAALLGTAVWSVMAFMDDSRLMRTNTFLTPYGIWLAGSVAWATIVCLIVREFHRVSAYAWAGFAGAALPAVLFGVLLSSNPGGVIIDTIPISIAMAIVTIGTVIGVALPRTVRGIVAICGYLLLLVYYTVAFGQAFLGYLQGA